MHDREEQASMLRRNILMKTAAAKAIGENKQLGLRDAEPPTENEIAAEVAAVVFSHWKSVPVA